MKIILLGNHWEPKWREYVKIVQLFIEYRILYKIDSEIVGIAMSAGNTHNPFMVVFVSISDSRSTSTMSSRRLPELQLNLCDSMAANADRLKPAPVQIYQSMSQKQCKCTVERGNFVIWKN